LLSNKVYVIEYIKPEGFIKIEIKETLKKGRHLLKFTADIDNIYIEIDEENNEHTLEVKVEEGGVFTTDLAILIGSTIFCAVAIFLLVYYVTRAQE
jgi:subtilase family serine protease